jgi:hypothetical protein
LPFPAKATVAVSHQEFLFIPAINDGFYALTSDRNCGEHNSSRLACSCLSPEVREPFLNPYYFRK